MSQMCVLSKDKHCSFQVGQPKEWQPTAYSLVHGIQKLRVWEIEWLHGWWGADLRWRPPEAVKENQTTTAVVNKYYFKYLV